MLNIKKWLYLYLISNIALIMLGASRANAQLTIVDKGKSTFSIIIPENTSPAFTTSLLEASKELRQDIEISTQIRLTILRDNAKSSGKFISLGNTRQAQVANINTTNVPDEGFQIVTKNGNLYIIGPDTPDGKWTKGGGVSNGTANGVYTFLEDYLDVRWLMPGAIGRDVPLKSTFAIKDIDRTEKPGLINRRMPYLVSSYFGSIPPRDTHIQHWSDVQKLGFSLNLNHSHNWVKTVPATLYKDHPDWFAMIGGKRVPPRGNGYKLETTNPELVKYFAEKAIETLKTTDRPETFSLSPSDHTGWSQSPESQALYDPPLPNGKIGTSSLVLKFYADVSKIVQKEYPEGKLAGYIYDTFLYPPTKYPMTLPDNFIPVIAPSSITYGYKLYNQHQQKELASVLEGWAKVAPKNWGYYDLPNTFGVNDISGHDDRFAGTTGIITPAAPEILNFIFGQIVKNKITAAYIYGSPSWSNSAMANYILAKMMWNPNLNAEYLQREWLNRAYGPAAGKEMLTFYQALDQAYQEYSKTTTINWTLSTAYLKDIYAVHYPELERYFLQAKSQQMTDQQKQRLSLIEENLVVLQWRLRNAGFLSADLKSPLQHDTATIAKLLNSRTSGFVDFPEAFIGWKTRGLKIPDITVQIADTPLPQSSATTPAMPDPDMILLHATQGTQITILPRKVNHGTLFATYIILDQKAHRRIATGLFNEQQSIQFSAKAGQNYYLYMPPRPGISLELDLKDAAIVQGDLKNKTLTLSRNPASVLVYYPHPKSSIGIYQQEASVVISKGGSGATAALARSGKYDPINEVLNLDQNWHFNPDPKNDGLVRDFNSFNYDDKSWPTISALKVWQKQELSQDGIEFQPYENYHGAAWYRQSFAHTPAQSDKRLLLYFGGVDGNTECYLNGEKIGEHRLGKDFKGWDEYFYFDITDQLKTQNTIAVKVTSKSNDTASGIFNGVRLLEAKSK